MRGDTFRFADLFAGLGGFHVALEQLGGTAVYAAEWNAQLRDLYLQNFGLFPDGDINLVDPDDVPDHEVLTAGFPCQPFSKAGEQLGFDHTAQGRLFFSVEDILRAKRPAYFILENVPNLIRHKGGATITLIEARLRSLGYDVGFERLSPHQFGIPQIRERVYIVGSLEGLDNFSWPTPDGGETSVTDVLDTRPSDARPISKSVLECLCVWDDFLSASSSVEHLPSFPIWAMEFGADYPFEQETPYALMQELGANGLAGKHGSFGTPLSGLSLEAQRDNLPSHALRNEFSFPKWKVDFIRHNRAFYAQNSSWIDPLLPRIRSFPSSFQKFEWNAQGEERSIWNFVIQLRASGVRVKRPRTAPSLVAMTDTQVPIIGWEKRYMTPRECARLQSLDHIELPANRSAAYRALGNAVNARVVARVAEALFEGAGRARLAG